MGGAGIQMFNCSRISVVKFLMDNFPFRSVLGVDGSNDLAINHPTVLIPFYTEPVFLVTNFV
jgi:hypothetical protein